MKKKFGFGMVCAAVLATMCLMASVFAFGQEAIMPVMDPVSGDVILPAAVNAGIPGRGDLLIACDENHWQIDGRKYAYQAMMRAEILPDGRVLVRNARALGDFNLVRLKDPCVYTVIGAHWTPFHRLWIVDKHRARDGGFIASRPEGNCFNFKNFK